MARDIVNAAHHDGYSQGLKFTLSICLCYTLCILGLRLYIRWRAFGIDDVVVALASALTFVFFGCSYALVAAGLAEPIGILITQQDSIARLNTLTLVNTLSWIIALCLSKLAIITMLLRTTLATGHRRLQYIVGALIAIQCIASAILFTAKCTSFNGLSWDVRLNNESCSHQALRWRVVTGLDISTELAILVLPLHLVWNLQMTMKSKIIVIVAFWLRIPTLAFTSFRNHATNDLSSTADVSLTAGMVVIWQTLELSYSLAAATIVALKRFTESLNTGFGHGELIRVHGQTQSYKLSDRSATLKDSSTPKPSVRVATNNTGIDALGKESRIRVRYGQPKLRLDDTFSETKVSALAKDSGDVPHMTRGAQPKESITRHNVQNSVHYDEEPLVPE